MDLLIFRTMERHISSLLPHLYHIALRLVAVQRGRRCLQASILTLSDKHTILAA